MLNISLVIAAGVVAIYTLFGPIVLLAIYIFLNRLAEGGDKKRPRQNPLPEEKDPALWSPSDVRQHLKDKKTGFFGSSGPRSGRRAGGTP